MWGLKPTTLGRVARLCVLAIMASIARTMLAISFRRLTIYETARQLKLDL